MSEQDGSQSSTKQRRSRKTSTANQQNGMQAPTTQRPTNDDTEAWKEYWKVQGQPWRTEPEIDTERQKYLDERRSVKPDFEQGIYPFKDIKLSRADVEWLLATHENGSGPVDWNDESQRERKGLDLRGADLRKVNMKNLPLARLCGGLKGERWNSVPNEQLDMAAVHMEEADLRTNLEGAILNGSHLEGADLRAAHLELASLSRAHLEGVRLHFARLESAYLRDAHLEGAILYNTNLKKANLMGVYFVNAYLNEAYLEGAHLEGVILSDNGHIGPRLADIHWDNANLAVVKWSQMEMLGDEYQAYQKRRRDNVEDKTGLLKEFEQAVRANRQLAVALQGQGLNEHAARFTYRAQLMQRKVFWYQRKFVQYLGSLFLDLLSGYGYKPVRCFIAYLLVIFTFAITYFIIAQKVGPVLSPLGSVVFSMTSFHGRGFFPGGIGLDDPLTVVAAFEAFIGLLIEVTFIATLTQRLFGK